MARLHERRRRQHRTLSPFATPPRVVVPGDTAAIVVDLEPGASTAMHRTVSLDYGVVIEGEVESQLDDGEVQKVRKGDVVV
jgi:quercetin dioxygenase-like cupin family protein